MILPSFLRTLSNSLTVSGILFGLWQIGRRLPIVGITMGGGKHKQSLLRRLNWLAPADWRNNLTLEDAGVPYHEATTATVGDLPLDGRYEAKAARFLQEGDCFWVIGRCPDPEDGLYERLRAPSCRQA